MVLFIDCESRELRAWLEILYDSGFAIVSVCPEAMSLAVAPVAILSQAIGEPVNKTVCSPGSPSEVLIWRIFFQRPMSFKEIDRHAANFVRFMGEIHELSKETKSDPDTDLVLDLLRAKVINLLNAE